MHKNPLKKTHEHAPRTPLEVYSRLVPSTRVGQIHVRCPPPPPPISKPRTPMFRTVILDNLRAKWFAPREGKM